MSEAGKAVDGPAPGILTYRAYRTNRTGGIVSAEIVVAFSDDEAKEKTSGLVNGHGIDLWERARFLARFPPLPAVARERPVDVRVDVGAFRRNGRGEAEADHR